MRLLLAICVTACGGAKAPPVRTEPPPPVPVAKPAAEPAWPMPMRVMTWTRDGLVQVGTLPDAPPATPPATPWYVEPTGTLDAASFGKIVVALRRDAIPGLSLRGQPALPLGELRELPALTALVLDDSDVDTAALHRTQLALRRLYLARTRIDDAGVQWIARTHAQLEVIDLEGCAVGDAALAALSAIPSLRAINAAGTRVTDAGGALLGALPNLEVVDLGRTAVGVKTVEVLAPKPLHQLFLDRTHAGRAVAKLANMAPRLERIDLSWLIGYRPIDADVAWIATAPNLVEVGLSGARISDKLVLALARLPRLQQVRLAGTPITSKSIAKLAGHRELVEIDLAETAVTDANAAALLGLPKLRVLRLDRTAISDAGLASPTAPLIELYFSKTSVTDAGLAILDALPALEGLGLGETAASDATIARIAKLANLRTLVLTRSRARRESLVELGKLTQLERLYLDASRADSATIISLQTRELHVLHVADTSVADDALPTLRQMPQLEELTIGDTRVTAAITDVAAWRQLRTLSIVGLEIGDAHLPQLARAASLARLDLSATDVTDPTPLAALPNLRELGLSQTPLSTAGKSAANALARRGVSVIR